MTASRMKVHCHVGLFITIAFLGGGAFSVNAQTCELTLYVLAEKTKGYLPAPQVTAENLNNSRKYVATSVGEHPVIKAIPAGVYKVILAKKEFASHVGEVEVNCGSGADREVHAYFTLCSSSFAETFYEGRQVAKGRNVNTVMGSPEFGCRQHRQRPVADREEELNSQAVWKEVVRNTRGIPYFIDTSSFERNANFVVFRVKSEEPDTTNFLTARGNCAGRTMKLTNRFAIYSFSRRLVALAEDNSPFQVVEGTVMEGLLNHACAPGASSDDDAKPVPPKRPVPRQISGGLLNGKALELPRPPYPPAARAVKASGAVSVQVLVDEDGKVISASAVSGHPLLQAAAVKAAYSAKFEPTTLNGIRVKVSGVITYAFIP